MRLRDLSAAVTASAGVTLVGIGIAHEPRLIPVGVAMFLLGALFAVYCARTP